VLQGRTSFRSPPSPQQRHAVLDSVDGPARRAHGAVRASSSFRIRSSRTASSSPCSFSISSNRHSFAAILAGRLGLGGLKPPRPWRPQASGCARPAGPVRRYGRQGRAAEIKSAILVAAAATPSPSSATRPRSYVTVVDGRSPRRSTSARRCEQASPVIGSDQPQWRRAGPGRRLHAGDLPWMTISTA
jgi:hypothetical protein